jgi:hypothetical protein
MNLKVIVLKEKTKRKKAQTAWNHFYKSLEENN